MHLMAYCCRSDLAFRFPAFGYVRYPCYLSRIRICLLSDAATLIFYLCLTQIQLDYKRTKMMFSLQGDEFALAVCQFHIGSLTALKLPYEASTPFSVEDVNLYVLGNAKQFYFDFLRYCIAPIQPSSTSIVPRKRSLRPCESLSLVEAVFLQLFKRQGCYDGTRTLVGGIHPHLNIWCDNV